MQPRQLGLQLGTAVVGEIVLARQLAGELARLPGDLQVVRVASGAEHLPDLLVGESLHESRLDQRGVAATLHDVSQDPVQVLVRLFVRGEGVDGVLDADRAEALEPPPDLDPEVVRLGRNLVDEEQPPGVLARLACGGHGRPV